MAEPVYLPIQVLGDVALESVTELYDDRNQIAFEGQVPMVFESPGQKFVGPFHVDTAIPGEFSVEYVLEFSDGNSITARATGNVIAVPEPSSWSIASIFAIWLMMLRSRWYRALLRAC